MTKEKAIKMLNNEYDKVLWLRKTRMICDDDYYLYLNDVLIALLTAIDALEEDANVEVEPGNGWISIKERMPENVKPIVLYNERIGYALGYFINSSTLYAFPTPILNKGMFITKTRLSNIDTYWMYLPTPPKEDAE